MGTGSEEKIATLVILAIVALAIYRLVLWLKEGPRAPDPWPEEIDKALNQEGAVPLCHHCLTPQEHNGWFCPKCGATVGPYCNYMPYVYIFSQGEVLRVGVTERLRRSPLIIIGYFLLSLGTFAVAAPVYWFFLVKNLRRSDKGKVEASGLTG